MDGDPVCPRCRPAVEAASTGPSAPTSRRRWRTAGALVVAAALLGLLIALAVSRKRGGGEGRPPPAIAADGLQERMATCLQALERGAVAVETYHAETGVHPADWEALMPDLLAQPPVDPWSPDGAPMRLLVPPWDDAAILLYSVGPDGQDDGGRAYAADVGVGDVVYVVR